MRVLPFILLATFVALAASQSLVIIGGNLAENNKDVWDKVVELAGGKGVARIGLFTTASADPLDSVDYYTTMFVTYYGAASATFIPVTETSNNADDPEVADLVRQQTGIFFGGGDQARILKALRPKGRDTLVLNAVKDLLKSGAVIGGTSAGAACLSDSVMVTSGASWNGLDRGAFSGGEKPIFTNDLTYDEYGGLGFLAGWLPDTHFSERGREGRLIRLLQDTKDRDIGTPRGFGIDEDMAVVVTDLYTRPVGKIIGAIGGVFVVDVTNTIVTPSANTNYEGVIAHYLTQDDSIDLTTGNITIAPWKDPLKGKEFYMNAAINKDILSYDKDRQWASAAVQFFNNKMDDTVTHFSMEENPQFQVSFDRTKSGSAFGGYLQTNLIDFVVSYTNLQIGIREAVNNN